MLYWITQQLAGRIPGAHVFAYLTFRAILATASALGLSLLVGPSVIRHLVRGQIGQVVRDDGPPTHLLKAGTPTMGGTLILVATLVSTLLWAELTNRLVWTVLGVTFAFGLIGFYDDYLKLMVRNPKGLVPRWKYFWQSVAGLATACVGFRWFNSYPAQVFMGDVGALAIGAAIGVLAVIVRQELVVLVMSGVFVLETASVILQVASFKLTGKRIFRMAPIHHHFELKGWAEPKVIVRFWIISLLLVLAGLATLKLR